VRDIVKLWKDIRRLIDERLNEVLGKFSEVSLVNAARYVVSGGKRFRGFLTIVVAKELGARIEDALDAAVAVELVHAASLALDDIIDADVFRRGKPAAWVTLGVSKAVMTANLLVPYAQKIVQQRYGSYALERTVEAWLKTSQGEALDAFAPKADYLTVVRLKTGALFRLAAELGAIAARRGNSVVRLAGEYGEALGIAYQIADDVVDLLVGIESPGANMLVEWLGTIDPEAGVREAYRAAIQAAELAEELVGANTLLVELPMFMVKVMLAEAKK